MTRRCVVLFAVMGLAACQSSTPLSHATSLSCPSPGPLPFRLASHGFHTTQDAMLATAEPRDKDQASDTLGNPGGSLANIFLADTQSPSPGAVDYQGQKARGDEDQGFDSQPFVDEEVSLWTYDGTSHDWSMLGRSTTDTAGDYSFSSTGFVADNGTPVYSILEADGSCAAHYDYLLAAGAKVVVADIDGTLTTSNDEFTMQVFDGSYVPKMMTAANTLTTTWSQKGYAVIYLTARPHVFRAESRAWLDQLGFATGPLITTDNASGDPSVYKTLWLKRMISQFGWQVVAAYGNEATDITAYLNVGIPTDHIFIIGPVGGQSGTVAIANNDYTDHISSFVDSQPNN